MREQANEQPLFLRIVTLPNLAIGLEKAAFASLLVLSAVFAFEARQPVLSFAKSIKLTTVECIIATVLVLWIASQIASQKTPRIPHRIAASLLVWLGFMLVSALAASSHRSDTLYFMGRMVTGVLIGWTAYNLIDNPFRLRMVLIGLAISGAIVSLLGLAEALGVQSILGWLSNFKVSQTRIGDVIRISSTLSYATITAMVLEMILAPSLMLVLLAKSLWFRLLSGGVVLVALLGIVLTLSRAGIIALIGGLALIAVYGFLWHERRLIVGSIAATAALGLFVILTLVLKPVTSLRLSSETEQSWYRSGYDVPEQIEARPGSIVEVAVRLTNEGDRTWNTLNQTPFELSYHLYDEQHNPITYEGDRSPLPVEVAPGQSISVQAQVSTPNRVGTYFVEWDLLQEDIVWFSWKGNLTALTRLNVAGAAVEMPARINRSPPPTDLRVILPTPPRSVLWRVALEIARDHPLLGIGPDNFRWQYGNYLNLNWWNTDIHSNNLYLEWLADTGLPGFLLFLIFSYVMFRSVLPSRYDRSNEQKLILLALVASLAIWYIHGLFDYFFEFTPTYVVFWLILGFALRVRGKTYADRI